MNEITISEIRKLFETVERIATRPALVTQDDLFVAPALFKKLMECRTQGVVSIQMLVDGKPIERIEQGD